MSWKSAGARRPRWPPGRRDIAPDRTAGRGVPQGVHRAIGIAVGLVAVYLTLNLVVVTVALEHLVANPELVVNWQQPLTTSYSSPLAMVAVAAILVLFTWP
jgi:hypothetical protein